MSIQTFQGGLPPLRTKYNQHGTGFLSALKRFVVPLAQSVLPSIFGGVADVVRGDATPKEIIRKRGAEVLDTVGDHVGSHRFDNDDDNATHKPPPVKRYKKPPPPVKRKPPKNQKKQKVTTSTRRRY